MRRSWQTRIQLGLVVEDYPGYYAGPCVLVLQEDGGGPVHALWGLKKGTDRPAVPITAKGCPHGPIRTTPFVGGKKTVRVVYSDEAGRGNLAADPHFVIACAITHPDTQWHLLRQHYTDLANDVFDLRDEEESYDEYTFHAKDIWHGSGDFPRSRFSVRDRMHIMTRLSQVPALYNVPICVGMIDRVGLERLAKENKEFAHLAGPGKEKAIRVMTHAYCYAVALQHVDSWMATNCPDEVAMVIAEDTNEVKEAVRSLHEGAKKRDSFDEYYDRELFKTKRIIDSVNFVSKAHSPLLQIADHCAFLAKRVVDGCQYTKPIWKNVLPKLCKANIHEGSAILARVPRDALEPVESGSE